MPYYVIAPVLVEEYLPCALFRYFRKKKLERHFILQFPWTLRFNEEVK